jgi:hypothetical protein
MSTKQLRCQSGPRSLRPSLVDSCMKPRRPVRLFMRLVGLFMRPVPPFMLPPLLFMRQVQRFMLRDAADVRYAPICG